MNARLGEVPWDVRAQVAKGIRERADGIALDAARAVAADADLLSADATRCGEGLLSLTALAVERGELTTADDVASALSHCGPALTVRQLIHVAHHLERALLDELAFHDRLGATSQSWPMVTYAVRSATLEVIAAFAEQELARTAVRDPLTTLWSADVFDIGLRQEIVRAQRHAHSLAVILFDVDDMTGVNRLHGIGAGNRLLERLGIQARRYFRTHDWVARHDGDAIAVLLPETSLDQAVALATRFLDMVQQRIVLRDHKTEEASPVTLSAGVVGTDVVQSDLEPAGVLREAEAAVLRAKMNGRNRVEAVALQPTSVTIVGAATLLGVSARDVINLVRTGALAASRRGRHFHIDRAAIEEYRSRR
ncbi:MAG TPA: diguanylate cyclase [Vicinamibacterales bacterium]|nr:diguanylate cyclase [Vicinamibacterales bacterium]